MAGIAQIERLRHIYLQLNDMPQTIESLQLYFTHRNIIVSNRQIYRDLEDTRKYLLRNGEDLQIKTGEFNKKIWAIRRDTDAKPITNYDLDTYLLSRSTIPATLNIGRKESLRKIMGLLISNITNSKPEQNGNWDGLSMMNTHFYEAPHDEGFQKNLESLLWATANHRCLVIEKYIGDSVSFYKSIATPFEYHPLKIIYHRGSFFLAGWVLPRKLCLTLDIYQIKQFKVSNETFAFKRERVAIEAELEKRFGITQNIDSKVHTIVLEFSSGTGNYVMHHIWHTSQKFRVLADGNIELTLVCGINRELLGWIFQWMGNVKIIQPNVLIDYYNKQLEKMIALNNGGYLAYSNIFQPE